MNPQPEKNSTDHYQHGQFRAHGRVEMHLKGNIIYVDAHGPFNLELINALVALASLEVLEAHKQLLVMLKGAGLAHKATANVIPENLEGAEFTAPIAAQNYAEIGWPFRIFQSMEDAENWIHSLAEN